MRLQKVFLSMLFVVFFLLAHFSIRLWKIASEHGTILCNPGGPFGTPVSLKALILLGSVVMIFMVWMWLKDKSHIVSWPWLCIIAGGLGNLLERMRFGCIIDYINVPFFPIFNIADILLTLGVIGILWNGYCKKK